MEIKFHTFSMEDGGSFLLGIQVAFGEDPDKGSFHML